MSGTTLSVGLVIGAALASSVNVSISSVTERLSQLQQKSERINLGVKLGKSLSDIKQEGLKVGEAFQKTGFKSTELKARLMELQTAYKFASAEAKKYGFEMGHVCEQTKRLETLQAYTESRIERGASRMARVQKRNMLRGDMLALGGMVYGAKKFINPAIDFEDTFASLKKVTDMSATEEKQMKRNLLDITTRIPMTGAELTQIAVSAGQMGIKGSQAILNFTTQAAKMGIAFDISAEEAGRAMAEIRNSSGLTQAQVLSLGDAINHLSDNTAGHAPQIVEFMRRIGGAGKIAGVAPEKLAALGTAFDAAGVVPERAARASNDLIMRLASITKQSKSVQSAFEAMGYDTKTLQKQMLADPNGTMLEFLERMGKQKNILASLSGTIGSGFADEIALLVANMDKYKEALSLVADKNNYKGSMDKEFGARSKTTANSLQLLKNRLSQIAITMGSVFLPPLAEAALKIKDFLQPIVKWAEENPKVIKSIGMAAVSFIGFKGALLAFRFIGSYVLNGLSLLNGGIQMIRPSTIQAAFAFLKMKGAGNAAKGVLTLLRTRAFGLGKTLLREIKLFSTGIKTIGIFLKANPIALAIMGIAIAGFFIWKYWKPIKSFFGSFWESLKTTWEPIGEAIKAPFVTAFTWIGNKIEWLSGKWESFKNTLMTGRVLRDGESSKTSLGMPLIGHALGGIFDKPHVAAFAEGGKKEAVIPLEGNNRRARAIYEKAGEHLGVKQSQAGTSFVYNITIQTMSTDATGIAREVRRMLSEFERKAKARERGLFADAPVFG